MEVKSGRINSKRTGETPKGAVKGKEELIDVTVEEIENGFLISKEFKMHFKRDKYDDYNHVTKKYFSKTNPLTITLDNKPLADKID